MSAQGFPYINTDGLRLKGRIPETTLQCIRYLRQVLPGSTISVEAEKPGREGLAELAAESDVVFYSKSWAEVSHIISVSLHPLMDTSVSMRGV